MTAAVGMAKADRWLAIGVWHPKKAVNIGSLWRSASLYGAAFVFTVGARYERQSSDTVKTHRHIPLFHFHDMDDVLEHLPYGCPLVAVEMDPRAVPLAGFTHPERAAYLLGAEDHGLPPSVVDRCHHVVQIESVLPWSMNVAVAGSIILHDRHVRATQPRLAAATGRVAP